MEHRIYAIKICYVNCLHSFNLSIIFFRLSAIQSPGTYDDKQLLIYWVVYSSLICIEYLGHNIFHALFTCIGYLGYYLFNTSLFYWLAKCIFLIWFMNSGSYMISRRFIQNTETLNDVQNSEYMLRPNSIIIEQKWISELAKYWLFRIHADKIDEDGID